MINRFFRRNPVDLWHDRSDREKFQALQKALYTGNINELKKRIKEGVSINTLEPYGYANILMFFVINEKKLDFKPSHLINVLIKLGIDIHHKCNGRKNNLSALHFAAISKNFLSAEALVKQGANIEEKDVFGNTPLWKAIMDFRGEEEMFKIVQMLLNNGADLDNKNDSGNSPRSIVQRRVKDISEKSTEENEGKTKNWDLADLLK